jgi:hypothetical protein
MRVMVKFRLPVEVGNQRMGSGKLAVEATIRSLA